MAWTDHRDSTTTTTAQQSGSYGDGENDSSSSSLSVTSIDEYFSTLEGDSHFEIDDYEIFGEFTYESEGRSERVFSDSKSYSSAGNSASWSTSFETESSWSLHSEVTEFGYTIIINDSDSDSYSESSGGQSYEPGDDDNPSNGFRPPVGTHGGGGSGGEGGGGSEGSTNATESEELRGALKWFKEFFTNRATGSDRIQTLPYFYDGNNEPMTKDLKWYSWMDDGRDPNWKRPQGYVWNHAGKPGSTRMELVKHQPGKWHGGVSHKGSASLARRLPSVRGVTAPAFAAITVYLTLKDAIAANGGYYEDGPFAEAYFVDKDGSVFYVQKQSLLYFRKRVYVAGPKKGTSEPISAFTEGVYQKIYDKKYGRIVPATFWRERYFIPGTERKTVPITDEYGREIGYLDENGPHLYPTWYTRRRNEII